MQLDFNHIRELTRRHRRRLATLAVALLACWIAYVAVWGSNGMVMYSHKRAEYRELQQKITEMQAENQRLEQENKALKMEPAAIEKEAREQLHYTKPGEVVYVQPDPQATSAATATAQNAHP
ncbi:MAG TPA: septum formation initiator family protein [Terriglobales bacterium]|nr:septum formation initiator family protein [Terriglobales bacterium]